MSNALTVYDRNGAKRQYLVAQVADLTQAVSMTQDLMTFSTGSVDYLNVLTAQQTLLAAQISLIGCDLARHQSVINLYQSMGGGR